MLVFDLSRIASFGGRGSLPMSSWQLVRSELIDSDEFSRSPSLKPMTVSRNTTPPLCKSNDCRNKFAARENVNRRCISISVCTRSTSASSCKGVVASDSSTEACI